MSKCFVKLCTKFQGKRACHSSTGTWTTWQPISFTYFASSLSSKFSRHSSFNLARNTCSINWCYNFPYVINTKGKIMNTNVNRKTAVLESLWNKVTVLQPWTLLKRDSKVGVFLWILQKCKKLKRANLGAARCSIKKIFLSCMKWVKI